MTDSGLFSDFEIKSKNNSVAHHIDEFGACVYVCLILYVQCVSRHASVTMNIKRSLDLCSLGLNLLSECIWEI